MRSGISFYNTVTDVIVYINVRMEMDADNPDIFTHQNIPRRVGCPCQTTSSWSDAPARPQGGPQRHRSEDKETTMQLGSHFNPRFS